MSNVPSDLKYTREHEWVGVKGKEATMGITDFAQKELGEIVYIELPAVGDTLAQQDEMGTVESVKAVAEFYAPVSGKIIEVNKAVQDSPELVNDNPYGEGWLVKIQITDASELGQLLNADEYQKFVKDS